MSIRSWIQSVWAEADAEIDTRKEFTDLWRDALIIRLMNDGHSVDAIYEAIDRYGPHVAERVLDHHHRLNWE